MSYTVICKKCGVITQNSANIKKKNCSDQSHRKTNFDQYKSFDRLYSLIETENYTITTKIERIP